MTDRPPPVMTYRGHRLFAQLDLQWRVRRPPDGSVPSVTQEGRDHDVRLLFIGTTKYV